MVVSSFAIGALAITVFQLGFVDALLTVLFINLLGITPVCFFSTFGPRYGLRQMVLSRFFFGYYGVKVSKYIPSSGVVWTILYTRNWLKVSNSRVLQHTRMRWMVCCQCHRRSSTSERSQFECSGLRRHHYHCGMHILDHALRIQGCSHVRDVLLDSLFHRFPHRPWRVRTFRSFSEFDDAYR